MARPRWIASPNRFALLPLFGAFLFLAASDPPAPSSEDEAQEVTGPPGGSPQRHDRVVQALDGARRAYLRGDLDEARSWFDLAASLFEEVMPRANPDQRWTQGNANQLLVSLQLYDWYARGGNLALDVQHDALVDWLFVIDVLNRMPDKPRWFRGLDVRYDLFSNLVREFGSLRVDYDLFTWQISQIGPYDIDYDLFTRNPRKIGDIEIEYDLFDHSPKKVAGVGIR